MVRQKWFFAGLVITGLFAIDLFNSKVNAGQDDHSETWRSNFEKAEADAKAQGVPLLIHFHAHWCGPCRTMESEVLETREVRAALKSGIVGVKVNADDRRDLVSRFGISSLPTDVIVSPTGQVLTKNVGSPGRSAYVARLAQFSVPARIQQERRNVAIAQTSNSSAKTTISQISQQRIMDAAVEPSVPVESEIVALEGSPADDRNGVGNTAKTDTAVTGGTSTKLMTKALGRESDRRVGLHGYSPVSLTESETWKSGDTQYLHEYQGVCYRLSSAEELDRFKSDPEKYIPALHGCDPVSLVNDQVVLAGHIELGVTWRSRVYFFHSTQTRDEFLKNPKKFVRTNNLTFFSSETQG